MYKKEKNTDLQTAKSLHAEYQMLLKRATREGISPIERDYTMNMVNRTKSKINFELLKPHKKSENENSYEDYEYNGRR
jgi:hypothetical protein